MVYVDMVLRSVQQFGNLCKYREYTVRESTVVPRLYSLNESYPGEVRVLYSLILEPQPDPSTFDFSNSKAQHRLKYLLGEENYSEFKKSALRLRTISNRIVILAKQLDSFLTYRLFRWLEYIDGKLGSSFDWKDLVVRRSYYGII